MNGYFANLRLETTRELPFLGGFVREKAYAHSVRLDFTEADFIPEGSEVWRAHDIRCRSLEDGWLFSSMNPAVPVWIRASRDYSSLIARLAPCDNEGLQMERLLHLVRTAIECGFAGNGVISIHAAAIALPEGGVAFTAPSGTGKSSRAKCWADTFGALYLSDDRPAIRLTKEGAAVCGVPWSGKEKVISQEQAPLAAVCEVRRAPFVRARRLSNAQARRLLLQQCFIPLWDTDAAAATLCVISMLIRRVPIYRLFGGKDAETAERVRCALVGQGEATSIIEEERPDMRIKENFVLRNVMGEHVVMPVGKNIDTFEGMLVLNDVSAFLWENLSRPICREDLLEKLLGEFEVDEATASADLDAFLDKLRDNDLLEEE